MKTHTHNMRRQRNVILILFLFLPLLLLITFSYYPALKLLELSFSNWDGFSPTYDYVGFKNYIKVFKDADLFRSLANNLAYFVVGLFQIALGLYFALVLNGRLKGRNFYKSSIFMPYILNGVAVSFMFNFLYNYETSPVNQVLRAIGLGDYAVKWLGMGYWSNYSLAYIGLWKNTGFAMVVFLGALQSIPRDYYEAAEIDGANVFQQIRYITIPLLVPTFITLLLFSLGGIMKGQFDLFYQVIGNNGVLYDVTDIMDTFVYRSLKQDFDIGMSTAAGLYQSVFGFIVIMVTNTLIKRGHPEQALF